MDVQGRVTRPRFPLLGLASLLLLAAVAALWVRSYVVGDEVYRLADRRGEYLSVCRGRVTYFASQTAVSRRPAKWGYLRHEDTAQQRINEDAVEARVAARVPGGFRALGFAFRGGDATGDGASGPRLVFFPLWLPAMLLAVLPALWLRRRRRLKPGLCPACGYDLRATPGRCPECGTSPPSLTSEQPAL